MSDYSVFGVSAAGMSVEMTRLEVAARNIANAHTTRGVDGKPYVPQKVIAGPVVPGSFEAQLSAIAQSGYAGSKLVEIVPSSSSPRWVHEPGHPDADDKGMVAYPNVDMLTEMLTLTEASRIYSANVQAFNASKVMAMRALDIGGHK